MGKMVVAFKDTKILSAFKKRKMKKTQSVNERHRELMQTADRDGLRTRCRERRKVLCEVGEMMYVMYLSKGL